MLLILGEYIYIYIIEVPSHFAPWNRITVRIINEVGYTLLRGENSIKIFEISLSYHMLYAFWKLSCGEEKIQ